MAMMIYRISKYNPVYRINGKYIKDEWTDYSDIGKSFNGLILTERDYFVVENHYLMFIEELLEICQVDYLKIVGLEFYQTNLHWCNEQILTASEAVQFCKDCLRNRCWGKLSYKCFSLWFGWDYYLYISSKLSYNEISALANRFNLFTEIDSR